MKGQLEKALSEHGFVRMDENRIFYKKFCDKVSLFISEKENIRRANKIAVELSISINDPFLAQQTDSLDLSVFLSEKGVSAGEEGLAIWWKLPEDEAEISDRILSDGFSWFAEFSNLNNLIDYFEKSLTFGISNKKPKENFISAVIEGIFFPQTPLKSKALRHPPVYNYYLSILYFQKGDFDNSRKFALRWFEFVKIRKLKNEPERTIRHLTELGIDKLPD